MIRREKRLREKRDLGDSTSFVVLDDAFRSHGTTSAENARNHRRRIIARHVHISPVFTRMKNRKRRGYAYNVNDAREAYYGI